MPNREFYQMLIMPRDGATEADIEKKLNLAADWFRYHPQCWIVFTAVDAATWSKRLMPLAAPDGQLFICRLNTDDYHGFMTKDLWDWIEKYRAKRAG